MPNYIYALRCPIENEIRYIGKTNNPSARLISHIVSARKGDKSHWTAKWIRKVLRNGAKPVMEILEELDDSENWEEYERFYIQNGEYFGWRLTNTTPGGEGGGYVRPDDKEAWRKNVYDSLQCPEVRQRISEGVKVHSARSEVKAAQSERFKEKWQNPEYRARMEFISAAANADPALRELRSINGKAQMADPEARKNVSEKLKAFYSTEEGRANKTEVSNRPEKKEASRQAQLKNWQDPSYRAKNHAAKTTPEVLAKQKVGAEKQHADPVMKEKMRQGMLAAWVKRKIENPGRTPEEQAIWREERLATRRQKRADESPEVREQRLAERRAKRKAKSSKLP